MRWTKLLCGLMTIGMIGSAAWGAGFSWKDTEGKFLDLLYDGQKVTRYMYDYDESNAQRTFETYKVLHHVFDEQGKNLLTNGPDGENPYSKSVKYPHHRGIFIGWNKFKFEGKSFDTWHMKNGVRQIHQKFLEKKADANKAVSTALIHWKNGAGKVMIEEKRTTTVYRPGKGKIIVLDFETELKAANGEVYLDGDPEHAGFQYRPHNDVAKGPAKDKAKYLFHKAGIDPKKDKDLPWVAMGYGLNSKRYSVLYINHPQNPKGALYSAYRDYGRFGSFFKKTIEAGKTLPLNYRIIVMQSEMPTRQAAENLYRAYVTSVKR
jgi:methane monooxygenase PmoA-like